MNKVECKGLVLTEVNCKGLVLTEVNCKDIGLSKEDINENDVILVRLPKEWKTSEEQKKVDFDGYVDGNGNIHLDEIMEE